MTIVLNIIVLTDTKFVALSLIKKETAEEGAKDEGEAEEEQPEAEAAAAQGQAEDRPEAETAGTEE